MPDLKAICLLSGGLDSATVLAIAKADGCEVITLTVHYGQLHAKEIESAKTIARYYDVENIYVEVPFQWGGSALTDKTIELPKDRDEATMAQDIPVSYVPARNTVFLSLAASVAEARGAERIYIGANAVDYSGYPDCRPEYFDAFQKMIQQGTKSGVGGCGVQITTPLIHLTKAQIIEKGLRLKVPYELTWSCYAGTETPCQACDACILRAKGFKTLGIQDPLLKLPHVKS